MVNKVIRFLLFYDFVLNFAFGLLSPIFAVFVLENIEGSKLQVIGIATACYWIARVLTTVPLSRFMDRTDGERDEFYFLFFGGLIVATVPLLYLVARLPWHIYLIQFVYGLANSMVVPGWRILFTDHIDRERTGFNWSLQDVEGGVAVGASGFLGSIAAAHFGFGPVLVVVSILGYIAVLLLLPIFHDTKTLSQMRVNKEIGWIRKIRKHILPLGSHRLK